VRFREITSSELERQLQLGEWRDKAGAYAIQGCAGELVEEIEGEVETVIGLPRAITIRMLEAAAGSLVGGPR
jgi:septum formation protein